MKKINVCSKRIVLLVFILLLFACNKEEKLRECPDDYDCITDIIELGEVYPCPVVDTVILNPFPDRIDDNIVYRLWFNDPHGCWAGETAPDVDFSNRTVIGKVYHLPDANDEYKGCSVCISTIEKRVVLIAVFKKPKRDYGHELIFPIFLSIPKIPTDYQVQYILKGY